MRPQLAVHRKRHVAWAHLRRHSHRYSRLLLPTRLSSCFAGTAVCWVSLCVVGLSMSFVEEQLLLAFMQEEFNANKSFSPDDIYIYTIDTLQKFKMDWL